MSLIYSSFADSLNRPLPGLVGEFTELLSYLNSKEVKDRVDFQVGYGKSVNDLTTELIRHQKDLRLFHFSGHSGQDGLDFPEADFETTHFSNFFNTLNSGEHQLECVLLNGCSNAALVKKLSQVPVVIGSTSPILNGDAIKFTRDFFSALISGKVSYEQAFEQAKSALPASEQADVIRGGGALANQQSFNDYFMIINDEEVAKRGFPLKRPRGRRMLSWLIYLAVLLTIGAGVWFYLNKEDIIKEAKGYECPEWDDDKKCNVLVADFNNLDANQFISDGINKNSSLNKYLNARYRNSLKELIKKESITSQELPGLCGFDYLLTGAVDKNEKLITIELIPQILTESTEVEYQIGSLYEFRKTIKDIKDIDQDTLIISQICTACVTKDKLPPKLAEVQIQKLKNKPGAEKIFQQQYETMAHYYLQKSDTTNTIRSLDEIASLDINDKTLAALEAKSNLQLERQQFSEGYQTRSRYIQAVDNRLNYSAKYKMSAPEEDYKTAYKTARFKRANLVLKQPAQLTFANRQALEDFEFLQKVRHGNRSYEKEIKVIQDRLNLPPPPENLKPIQLVVRDASGLGIRNAAAFYNNQTYQADQNGLIAIPCPNNNCIGKWSRIKARGFESKDINLRRLANGMDISLKLNQLPPPEIFFSVKGWVLNSKQRGFPRVKVTFGSKKTTTDAQGKFELGSYSKTSLPGNVVHFSKKGFLTQSVKIEAFQQGEVKVVLVRAPVLEKNYTISGTIRDCKFSNTVLKYILINNQTIKLDSKGAYKHSIRAKPGFSINIQAPTAYKFVETQTATFRLTDALTLNKSFTVVEKRAQTYSVRGQIKVNGESAIGANVLIVGTSIGATTDFDGNFQMRVKGRLCQRLQVSYVGFGKKTIDLRNYPVTNKRTINVVFDLE